MNKVASNNPQIRFAGYTDNWRQYKLSEIATLNPKSSLPDSFEYIDLASVTGTTMLSHRTESKSSAPSRAKRLACRGDIFYQTVAPYQKNTYIYDLPYDNYVFSTGYTQMRPFVDNYFLFSLLQSDQFVNVVVDKCSGTCYPAINALDLHDIEVRVPADLSEQFKIGCFFKELDIRIACQRENLEKLKKLEKAYSADMFPSDGESNPERRFPGFSDTWKQCILKDVIDDEIKGKAHAEMSGTKSTYLETCYLNGGNISYVDSPVDVECDDVLILWDGAQAGTVYHGFEGALGSTLKAYKPKESGRFLYQFLKHKQQMIFNSYRIPNIPHVEKSFAMEFKVNIPCLEEQLKIGAFSQSLESLINFQQYKLEKLYNLKRAYLNEMLC
ncbi:MAG: restriction endonuclease subunit S [Christensenellaceae bacterium]|jgi:type I restriction enzyme S subunit|nr:restriction endonuclease subunit S [Christensenellaceae bacterium]